MSVHLIFTVQIIMLPQPVAPDSPGVDVELYEMLRVVVVVSGGVVGPLGAAQHEAVGVEAQPEVALRRGL